MTKKGTELHKERLATTDEHGHRVYLYPEDVKGKWRIRRTIFNWILIAIYLILPWLYWDGKQLVLINIPAREFTFFGTTFYSHDAPILIFVMVGFVFAIGFITSIWGRVWCGWACPQTVFIETIYRKIERIIEGKARARRALDKGPWDLNKIWKKGLKWTLWLLVSLHISHSFLGYFVGTHKLFWITLGPPTEHMTLFLFMLGITVLTLFDFGWFKEQFCLIACPYGRFQSVMMDDSSLIIAYDEKRGEPRRSPDVGYNNEGDCINCFACVKVCPTGIDIRRGTQMECIACTNCIDACDDIMRKVGRPEGLIRYDSEKGLNNELTSWLRPRTFIYLMAVLALFFGLTFSLLKSQQVEATLVRSKTPYKVAGDSRIVNHYKIRFDYKGTDDYKVWMMAEKSSDQIEVVTPTHPVILKKGHKKENIFFKFPKGILKDGSHTFNLQFRSGKSLEESLVIISKEVKLVGPLE